MGAYDAMRDARSESRYEADPRMEPDTREVAEATMTVEAPVSVPDGLVFRG